MKLDCIRLNRVILPAIRASVAQIMYTKYNLREEYIAKKLGVVQVAVSKYLNKKYSNEVKRVKEHIENNNLNSHIINNIINNKSYTKINSSIENLCINMLKSL